MISAAAVTPEPVRTAISEALGLRCAEQVEAQISVPGFDQAAVDGYAVRSVDVRHAGSGDPEVPSARLPVVGDISAGSHRPVRLQPRQAVRVSRPCAAGLGRDADVAPRPCVRSPPVASCTAPAPTPSQATWSSNRTP